MSGHAVSPVFVGHEAEQAARLLPELGVFDEVTANAETRTLPA
ncbi:hypothetical protein [Streptosporangium sp. KLBMP 9127]